MNQSRATLLILAATILVAVMLTLPCQSAPAPTPPEPSKPIVLKFASHAPPRLGLISKGFVPLLTELETKSKGRIKIEYYHAESLLKSADMWDGTVKGITDISWTVFAYTSNFPLLCDLSALPFSYSKPSVGGMAQLRLFNQGLLDKELNKAKVLGFDPTAPAAIISRKPIKTPADLKGKSFRAATRMHTNIVKTLGGSPVSIPIAETYVAIERGVVDGALSAYAPAGAFKLYEVCKYATPLKLGGLATGLVMNKARYEALPKDLQSIVDEVLGGDRSTKFLCQIDDAVEDEAIVKILPEAKGTIVQLSDAELAAFYKPLEPFWINWADAMEAKGLPAKNLINKWMSTTKELGYTVPIKTSF
jgi:TRAP-type C4-dicarboxylate transport system substrate-binding protein